MVNTQTALPQQKRKRGEIPISRAAGGSVNMIKHATQKRKIQYSSYIQKNKKGLQNLFFSEMILAWVLLHHILGKVLPL